MADKLAVTPSYLSAVENGKRNVPQGWLSLISELYFLEPEEENQLRRVIQESQLSIQAAIKDYSTSDQNIIMAFAREFKDLDEDNKTKIRDILSNHKKGGGK
jgi:transcriptional regulator with XRE-family HTH domain